jgi:hypothetical protein
MKHLMKHLISVLILSSFSFLSFILVACETTVKTAPGRGSDGSSSTVMPVPSQRNKMTGAGVALAFQFENADKIVPSSGCRWRLINKDNGKSYFIDLKGLSGGAYAAVTPGHYETGRVGCGLTKVWDLTGVYKEGFRVQDGSVSYLGKLNFIFRNGEFSEVRKNTRPEAAAGFALAAEAAPPDVPFVSGFTLLPITKEMAQASTGVTGGFEAFGKGLKDGGRSLEPLLEQLKTCESKASFSDPLRLGQLEYTAAFSKGNFREFKSRKDNNALADSFRDCVTARISEFRPPVQTDLEIRIRY